TIVGIAKDADIPMVGPNCMGVFMPSIGLCQGADQYTDVTGSMGYISQSGSQAMGFAAEAHEYGLYVSKSISMGNGSVVDSHDWLDYLAHDDDTKIIGLYLEGVRDGRKFFEALRAATAKKPVVVWKVGQTKDAARAGQFHTGSLAIGADLWDAMLRQAGAVKVNSLEEMIDTAKALINLDHLENVGPERRGALFALSGGHASEIADVFGRYGYGVPALSQESYDELATFALIAGGSFHNPFEGAAVRTEEMMGRALSVVDRDPNIDLVVMEIASALPTRGPTALQDRLATIQEFRSKSSKPFIAVLSGNFPRAGEQLLLDLDRALTDAGIPAFRSMERGARALRNALDYQAQRAWLNGE
ncbi:MAG: hypothetical protein NTZ05_20920, partial [Chloroflexi bacterium]|nr:hypothetical protein [Chloroflexota bacterium]